jgi:putative flippase GtrA
MSYALAIVTAYAVGMAVAFVLNKHYVFLYSRRPLAAEISFFVLFNVAAFPFVWVAAYVLGELVFHSSPANSLLRWGMGAAWRYRFS